MIFIPSQWSKFPLSIPFSLKNLISWSTCLLMTNFWMLSFKQTTEDEMDGWHHWLDGHEFEWTPGVGDGQGGLACCDSWGLQESDMTERLNWTEWQIVIVSFTEMPLFFMDSFLCYWILCLVLYFFASFLKTSHFCLHASKIFSLPLVFSCLSMMCLSMVFFVLILFGLMGLISFGIEWLDLLVVQTLSSVFSSTKVQRHQFFDT